jgi:hypothetical protein
MKVYNKEPLFETNIPKEDLEKIAMLKLSNVNTYIDNVGAHTKHQYLIPESNHDTERLKTLYSGIGNKKQKIRMLSSMSKGTI